MHSFRRYVETVIEDQTSANYADYILGHKKSVYYTKKEPERQKLYKDRCAHTLTVFDMEDKQETIAAKDEQIRNLEIGYDQLKSLVIELKKKMENKQN